MLLHLIITRFSVKFSPKVDKRILLDINRLNMRLKLFHDYCLPSMLGQKEKRFRWIILVDADIPEEVFNGLKNMTDYDFITIFRWDSSKHKLGEITWLREIDIIDFSYVTNLAMTRLDDDDALHVDFTATIKKLADTNTNLTSATPVIYSFPRGYISYKAKAPHGALQPLGMQANKAGAQAPQSVSYNGDTKPFIMPFIALGMTLFIDPRINNVNVYAFDHGKIKNAFRTGDYGYFKRFKLQELPRLICVKTSFPMYVYFLHGSNDSGIRYFGHLFKKKNKDTNQLLNSKQLFKQMFNI